ncbi:hypothetical protein BC826DRAFT_1107792 [Russula brevipes]|nr:hypothetical protein BC826DRAFT_1107792 [Russula brevipes]
MSSHNRAQKSVHSPVAVPARANIIAQCIDILPRAPRTDAPSEDLQMVEHLTHFQEEFDGPQGLYEATINKLPDDALLDIFDSYLNDDDPDRAQNVDKWHTLVHVCQRWRNIVFSSPRRLNLRLFCDRRRPVRTMLDIWPALPIVIENYWVRVQDLGLDNLLAALGHPDRVCSIEFIDVPGPVLEALATAIRTPFPELAYLRLWSDNRSTPNLPDSFLGGSAPRLRKLELLDISFPALPNLLLSASDLVDLTLRCVPHSGYISPEVMVGCLSSLNRLKSLSLGFQSRLSRPDQHSPPPQTRIVLHTVTDLFVGGMIEYSEDFLARIDTPVLNKFSTSFFLDPVFDVPHLKQFIGRAKGFKLSKVARVDFSTWFIRFCFTEPLSLSLKIKCDRIELEVNAMSLVCNQLSPFLSLVERLDLIAGLSGFKPQGEDDFESSRFLELFRPFTAIRSLHVSHSLVPLVTPALQQLIGPRTTEVLPNLRDLFLGGSQTFEPVKKAMQPFVTARQLSGHPVAIHHWGKWTADL